MAHRVSTTDYAALSEIRYRVRCFLNFSEAAARAAGVEPQQHQLLLAIRGLGDRPPTIGAVAERLQIAHNTAVELVARAESNGLLEKNAGERDRRQVLLGITPRGRRLLEKLAALHRAELRTAAPALVEALTSIMAGPRAAAPRSATEHAS